jgi:thioesterase domain-containing protein/acyl carrier protein
MDPNPVQESTAPQAPDRETIEAFLTARIARALDVPPTEIDRRKPFADYALDSVAIFEILGDVACWLRRDLEASLLWQYPTVEAAAQFLAAEENPRDSSTGEAGHRVLRIQPYGSQPPFFFIHGNTLGYDFCFGLAAGLGDDQPFYAVPPVDARLHPPGQGIEKSAAALVQSVREVRPSGPYVIGGFCAGGAIAYEVARQFETEGEKVDLLVMIDVPFPRGHAFWMRSLIQRLGKATGMERESQLLAFERAQKALRKSRHWLAARHRDKPAILAREIARGAKRLARARADAGRNGKSGHTPAPVRPLDWSVEFTWDLAGYRVRPYLGRVALFVSDELAAMPDHPSRGWQETLPQLELHRIAGSHMACITTHRQVFADDLASCLRNSSNSR